MAGGGIALKSLALFCRFVQFCCAAIILGIYSYFLATLRNHSFHIDTFIRAVEGISGAAVLYTLFALFFVCFLGGVAFFSVLGMLFDLAFIGAFIYVAYANRGGDGSCKGLVRTPFGDGDANTNNPIVGASNGFTRLPSLHTACKLETACFAVAIVATVFFLFTILTEFGLIKHHRHERRYGPSPNNGYTAGSPKRRFWQRKPKHDGAYAEKANPDALPSHAAPSDVRDSYATDTTAVGGAGHQEPAVSKYGAAGNYGAGMQRAEVGVPQHSGVVGSGANGAGYGHQTTSTTHVPPQGGYTAYNPTSANTASTTGTF